MSNQKPPIPEHLLFNARRMRQCPTDAENRLWWILREKLAHFKFRRQHPFRDYILDFYCHAARLAIELDGGQHADPEQVAADDKRTSELAKHGVFVLRFFDNDVLKDSDAVANAILECVEGRLRIPTVFEIRPHPSPLPEGEGARGARDEDGFPKDLRL